MTLDLFSAPPIRGKRSTSRKAASDTAPRTATQRILVLRLVAAAPVGLTRDQLSESGLSLQSACARVTELLNRKGRYPWLPLVKEAGQRPTRSGSYAAILYITKAGRGVLDEATR